jgi:hypothetical protein
MAAVGIDYAQGCRVRYSALCCGTSPFGPILDIVWAVEQAALIQIKQRPV